MVLGGDADLGRRTRLFYWVTLVLMRSCRKQEEEKRKSLIFPFSFLCLEGELMWLM